MTFEQGNQREALKEKIEAGSAEIRIFYKNIILFFNNNFTNRTPNEAIICHIKCFLNPLTYVQDNQREALKESAKR